MISDFQGARWLTDPTVHSKHKEFSESGDFGHSGFATFFSKHTCNDICKLLKLEPFKFTVAEREKWIEKPMEKTTTIRFKCNARLCNNSLEIGEKIWCASCCNLVKIKEASIIQF